VRTTPGEDRAEGRLRSATHPLVLRTLLKTSRTVLLRLRPGSATGGHESAFSGGSRVTGAVSKCRSFARRSVARKAGIWRRRCCAGLVENRGRRMTNGRMTDGRMTDGLGGELARRVIAVIAKSRRIGVD
jgi:hypothetical protein